jgi:hypothetical protein
MEDRFEDHSMDDVSFVRFNKSCIDCNPDRLACSLLFTMSFLDRVSTGTARLAGLERDLNMSGGQFNNVTVIFFVGYVGQSRSQPNPFGALWLIFNLCYSI